MTTDNDHRENPSVPEGSFEIVSATYRWFLWIVLVVIVAMDFMSIALMYINGSGLSLPMQIVAVLGICLKMAIFWILVAKKGPLEILVYIWGGLMLVSGFTGLLSFVVSGEPTPTDQYLNKFIILALGIALVVPLSWTVQRSAVSD